MLYLALFNLVYVVINAVRFIRGERQIRWLRDWPPAAGGLPRLSIIAAARDEAEKIAEAVASWRRLDYPDLEMIIVNDRSTDQTGPILQQLAAVEPRLRELSVGELPAGWLGKNHALHLGARQATGEWLLFTDADVVLAPDTLRRAVGYAREHGLDHLALTPHPVMPGWFLKSFVLTFSVLFLGFMRGWQAKNPRSKAHIGIGAFNLVRAAAYRAVGGHAPIRMRPDDDIKLGKLLKKSGHRQELVNGSDFVSVRWYASVRELTNGLMKNIFAGVEYHAWAVLLTSLMILALVVWPFLAVFLLEGPPSWLYLAIVLTLLFNDSRMARGIKVPVIYVLGYPLAVSYFAYLQWRALLLTYRQGGIRWRGTLYPLKQLRANKV